MPDTDRRNDWLALIASISLFAATTVLLQVEKRQGKRRRKKERDEYWFKKQKEILMMDYMQRRMEDRLSFHEVPSGLSSLAGDNGNNNDEDNDSFFSNSFDGDYRGSGEEGFTPHTSNWNHFEGFHNHHHHHIHHVYSPKEEEIVEQKQQTIVGRREDVDNTKKTKQQQRKLSRNSSFASTTDDDDDGHYDKILEGDDRIGDDTDASVSSSSSISSAMPNKRDFLMGLLFSKGRNKQQQQQQKQQQEQQQGESSLPTIFSQDNLAKQQQQQQPNNDNNNNNDNNDNNNKIVEQQPLKQQSPTIIPSSSATAPFSSPKRRTRSVPDLKSLAGVNQSILTTTTTTTPVPQSLPPRPEKSYPPPSSVLGLTRQESVQAASERLSIHVKHQNRAARSEYNARIMPDNIILIRHGQSLGNINEELYATTPDNAMPLTELGWEQAKAAGTNLKNNILQDDSMRGIHFILSPYVRTVETFHGILSAWCDPIEFNHIQERERRLRAWYIKLHDMGLSWHEDPRIREQDFGNYQEPERILQAKRDRYRFGAFYYRFPHGESASDVFDRVSTFLDSLWRSFDTKNTRNYVLITHGISIRVILARYFRYTIDQFHMLANPRNCEMVVLSHNGAGRLELEGRHELEMEEQQQQNENNNGQKNNNKQTPKVIGYKFHKRLRVLPEKSVRKVKIRMRYGE